MLSFWKNLDDSDKAKIRVISGCLMAVVTLLTLIACISYLFTWKVDQSLLSDPAMMSEDVSVHNLAGKLGYRWANFLVGRFFGLGSFALIVIMAAVSVRLLFRKEYFPIVKGTLIIVFGAMIASFLLSWVASLAGPDNSFGGGLGGECGSSVVRWSNNLFGPVITFLLLLILLAIWLFFLSRRFTDWLIRIGAEEPRAEEVPGRDDYTYEYVTETETGPGSEYKQETGFESLYQTEEESFTGTVQEQPVEQVVSQDPVAPADQEKDLDEENLEDAENPAKGMEIVRDDIDTEIREPLAPFDNRKDKEIGLLQYQFPPLDILKDYSESRQEVTREELERNNNKIRATLRTFKIEVSDVKAIVGPTVTLYKVYPAPGVKINQITNLQDEIAMYLHANGVRTVKLPDSVGIEVANDVPSIVPLKAMLNDDNFRSNKYELPIAIGYTITQNVKVFDLADAPHLLVAGATKMGKSVCLNVIIASLLYAKHPSELKMVFIDPKMVEFSSYSRLLKHYLAVLPSASDEQEEANNAIVKKAPLADQILRSLCIEMDSRYELLSKAEVQNIKQYNKKYKERHLLPTDGHHFLPYMVIIIDEYADLTMTGGVSGDARAQARSISASIIRLAQKGRAAGIHVILATQRPSVDVITGLIKTNFPTRIAFRVVSRVDSATILDSPGAEKLIGRGDMLYYAGASSMERIQCAFIDNDEITAITNFIGSQTGWQKSYNVPYYLPEPDPASEDDGAGMIDMKHLDERFEEAAKLVVISQKGSTSDLQRRLGMGYAKAGRVMDQLEAAGIVGPQSGSKPREVLVPDLNTLDGILKAFMSNQ